MSTTILLVLAAALFLAYANGANDNFKGVATLFGSGAASYRGALIWATVTTYLGCLSSAVLAGRLVKAFSGQGLVPDTLVGSPQFLTAVAVGGAATVFLATRTGFPISTTHALTGALVGAGGVAAGSSLNLGLLGRSFFLPLAVSPLLAFVLAGLALTLFGWIRNRFSLSESGRLCLCLRGREYALPGLPWSPPLSVRSAMPLSEVALGSEEDCARERAVPVLRLGTRTPSEVVHFLSAGAVSFARGLNDAPKIAGVLVVFHALGLRANLYLIATAMALGGLLHARRVGETMGRKITSMTQSQGLLANLSTSALVLGASHLGVPVSTTHVSCGSLFGIGASTSQGDQSVIRQILLSWVLTLPCAALIAAAAWYLVG